MSTSPIHSFIPQKQQATIENDSIELQAQHDDEEDIMKNEMKKKEYKLCNLWNLYYHLPQCKIWDLDSYKFIMKHIKTVNDVIALNEQMDPKLVKHCMLFLMKDGITPMWEDKKNRNGGCFSFKVLNKKVVDVWKLLFYAVCGETLCVNKEHNELVNGITISPKKGFCIIKIWLLDCTLQDPELIIDIPNLSKQGCIFKRHEPEF
jgi:hypothetical protein